MRCQVLQAVRHCNRWVSAPGAARLVFSIVFMLPIFCFPDTVSYNYTVLLPLTPLEIIKRKWSLQYVTCSRLIISYQETQNKMLHQSEFSNLEIIGQLYLDYHTIRIINFKLSLFFLRLLFFLIGNMPLNFLTFLKLLLWSSRKKPEHSIFLGLIVAAQWSSRTPFSK